MKRRTPHSDSIAADAASWLGRVDAGLSLAEQREFEAWRAADPQHARAWREITAASRALDGLSALRPLGGDEPDPDLPLRRTMPKRRHWPMAAVLTAAAAVVVVVCLGVWARFHDVTYSDYSETVVGAQRTLQLPDGSMVTLNTNSAVRVAFTDHDRRLYLERGEAHFSVAHDTTRPFVVQTAAIRVHAVGTAFNIRLQDSAVEVLVTEGKVGVLDARSDQSLLPPTESAPVLAAGHRAMVAADAQTNAVVAAVSALEMGQKLAWQEQRLEFDPTPLSEVVAEFNRYGRRRLVILDPETAGLRIGGSFRAGDTETLVRLLETNFGVSSQSIGNEIHLRRR